VDLKDDHVVTMVRRHDEVDPAEVAATFARLCAEAAETLRAEGVADADTALVRTVDARYLGEAHEIAVPAGEPFDADAAAAAFHDAHERIYGYAYREGEVVELVNWKVTGLGRIERPRLEPPPPTGSGRPLHPGPGGPGYPATRAGFAVYRREDLPAGFRAAGPAIVEEYGSTTVVEEGFTLEVDRLANLVLRCPSPLAGEEVRPRTGGGE
jgi:N-methylhydantoinase A